MYFLSEKIVKKLIEKKITISVCESCTGGLLSSAITSVSGSSKIFVLGLVAYSNQSKNSVLKIPKKILRVYGAVSYETCLSMVRNLSKIGKTGVSVSITGIAGPKGGTRKKPVGLVYIGIKKGNKTLVKKHLLKNKGRLYIQRAAVNKSLELILSFIK
jgi:PncC family amidohydrolase